MRPHYGHYNEAARISRRHFLKSCVASGLFAGSVSAVQIATKPARETARAAAKHPNIIFIFADDWGYGDLGIHGSAFCKTPHLDRMATEGIDFQQFTVNNPVCSPSRTAVMTGQFPARHCIHQHFASVEHHQKVGMPDWLDPKLPLLPKLLKKAGYVTGHFGKWHLTNRHIPDAPLPTEYGFDEYGAFNVPGVQISTAETCPRAIDFIRRHKNQPFFINVWLHETHTPHYPLPKYLERFEHLDKQKRVYAAVVAEADAGVGSILGTLKELGLDEKTLVIFSSDNGPEWTGKRTTQDDNSTGRGLGTYYSVGETAGLKGQKRSLFAGGIRVPFIARWPGMIPKGQIDRTSVLTAVDLLPTFLELAGQLVPANIKLDGQSIVAALRGFAFKRTKPIHWEWRGGHGPPYLWPHLGIRDGKWKMMVNQELDRTELYDIEADWAETTDLAQANPNVVKALTKKALVWKSSLPTEPPAHCFSRLRAENASKQNKCP
jgi:N-acetylgalactosamine-6-sulfatase